MCDEELLRVIEDAAETLAAADDRCAALQKAVNAAWELARRTDTLLARWWLSEYQILVTKGEGDE